MLRKAQIQGRRQRRLISRFPHGTLAMIAVDPAWLGRRHTARSHAAPSIAVSFCDTRQEKQEALTEEAGFLLRVLPRERQYAELGYLLPFYLRLSVETQCVGPFSWLARHPHISEHGSDIRLMMPDMDGRETCCCLCPLAAYNDSAGNGAADCSLASEVVG